MADHDELNALDDELLRLLNRRCELARGRPEPPEAAFFARLQAANPGPLPPASIHAVWRELLSGQRALTRPLAIAFLGPEASFTHQAASRRFGESIRAIAKTTIADVFDDVEKGVADYGVVPVENSTEGAVTITFDLFPETDLKICAEIHLRIHHHLLATGPLTGLRVVYSHPSVFGQCRRWLGQNLPGCQLVELTSTTAAAARAAGEPGAGAIAGELAAERYGLNVLANNIEDYTENITRFLVLHREAAQPTGDDKTSIMFALSDRVGALYDALEPFKRNAVNLSMIQSRPSKRKSWDYFFFVDFLGHFDDPTNQQALQQIAAHCKFVKHLGSYPRAGEPL